VFSLAGEPITVTPCRTEAGVPHYDAPFNHTVFLASAHADTPARMKWTHWNPTNSYLKCGWCWFCSSVYKGAAASTTYSWGYVKSLVMKFGKFAGQKMKALDPRLKLTHEDQVWLSQLHAKFLYIICNFIFLVTNMKMKLIAR
jgi:hypothetical protein